MSDDLTTPAGVESRLRRLVTDLTLAQQALANARDAEVEAKHAFEASRRRAIFSGDCPKVTRGGYTTADRDAWVDEQAKTQRYQYDLAVARREAAQDHLRVVRDPAEIVRSLGASVRQAYEIAGSGR
ncbi:hypothetical protein [Nonomuraea pusilla]|uniref:Uncharacterized protein n=1 Tax=Nonomuraea pusilla TaxID=46177 RepID=A0A1H8K7M6_9ACTN|nr:hypothetical protein [Nonomuraea pusilla]SEN89002.1 hypothetical protein SAMN05660976_08544 [Nonomuraea pusilla]